MNARRRRQQPVNVRAEIVGEADAERLDVETDRRTALATMGLGALLVVISAVVLVQASRLDNDGEVVGAATAPWVVGGLLLLVGGLLVVRGRRDMGVWELAEHTAPQDWKRLLALLVALIVFGLVVRVVGYVVAGTLLFGATAILLGSPHRLRSFAYGWCVAAVVFLLFDVAIGIALPTGPWGF